MENDETGVVSDGASQEATDAVDGRADVGAAEMQDVSLLDRAVDMLTIGGPVVALLLAASVIAVAIVLAKAWQFAVARPGHSRDVDAAVAHFRAGRLHEAQIEIAGAKGVMAEPVAVAITGLASGLDPAQVRADCVRVAADRIEALRGWMRPLEVIASLAPLLGLFGTVLGMIAAFAALEAAGNQVDPSILSGGIWEALLTTAVGLAVAIPTVVMVNWFERRIERCEHRLESALSAIFAVAMSAGASWPAEAGASAALSVAAAE